MAIQNALDLQQGASDAAQTINRDIYGQQQANLQPYMDAGAGQLPV